MKHALYALLLLASAANAAPSASLTATPVTTYVDGTPVAAGELAGYEWSCVFTPTNGTAAPCTNFTGGTGASPNLTATFTAPAAGGSACFQVLVKSVAGAASGKSNTTCKPVAPLVPSTPTNATVTITIALTLTSDSPITVAMAAPVVTTAP